MARKIYCDICGIEITNSPAEEQYDLQIASHSLSDKSVVYHLHDICHVCYLDITDEIKRKINFYNSKHEMRDGCVELSN